MKGDWKCVTLALIGALSAVNTGLRLSQRLPAFLLATDMKKVHNVYTIIIM